jgi:F-type H+-transporting ATPase subunit delta
MSDSRTIARPYARAVFEHALARNKLAEWSKYLQCLARITRDENVSAFLTNPASNVSQHIALVGSLFLSLAGKEEAEINNLIETLAHAGRLTVLSEISVLYEALRSEQEKSMTVTVFSCNPLSDQEEKHLIESLGKRLNRQVTLKQVIDKELIGGAVIQAGDLVIDGSVRGKINKLRTGLAA